jgi:periplasmic protein TonB
MSAFLEVVQFPYGLPELKANYRKYLIRGLVIGIIFNFSLVGAYWGVVYLDKDEPPMRVVRIIKYSELGPPPSITDTRESIAAKIAVSTEVKPSIGIPVPVPDAMVNPEQTFASQTEMSQYDGPEIGEGKNGDQTIVAEASDFDLQIEDEGPPPDFVPFEKGPAVVKRVEPVYPELARKAGMEGRVIVKVWIDKKGKVKDVVILKGATEVLNDAAINAAKQWEFTPAMMKHGPVDVWSTLTFNFKLNGSDT